MHKFEECGYSLTPNEKERRWRDRVTIPMAPVVVEKLATIFEERALNATSYFSQGIEREMAELFKGAILGYESARVAYDVQKEVSAAKEKK